ncbi:MAG: hypothetical protein HZB26_22670 [Candidatus Hydrogenedentes bacterium]|nr:hypothetical protein [Candidatus Hydrogenedentota bacterium]
MTKRTSATLLAGAACLIALLGYSASLVVPRPADGHTGAYVVGAWNLEHFREGTVRGFPENTRGGPSYPPRTDEDYNAIASMISRIEARILVLEEINAHTEDIGGKPVTRSKELDRLIRVLGPERYDYVVGATGGAEHIAILYDKRDVRLNETCECEFPDELKVENKAVFDREPLLAHFTFLSDGRPMNDLTVVGVHLASGQQLTKNHDEAMRLLQEELKKARQESHCIPSDENDILIAGDFNTGRFDKKVESFWDQMEREGWDVLGDDPASYPVTRLSGVPLKLRDSRIDYLIISKENQGLAGEEVETEAPVVHNELVGDSPEDYRRHASDHLPITVEIRVLEDTDR